MAFDSILQAQLQTPAATARQTVAPTQRGTATDAGTSFAALLGGVQAAAPAPAGGSTPAPPTAAAPAAPGMTALLSPVQTGDADAPAGQPGTGPEAPTQADGATLPGVSTTPLTHVAPDQTNYPGRAYTYKTITDWLGSADPGSAEAGFPAGGPADTVRSILTGPRGPSYDFDALVAAGETGGLAGVITALGGQTAALSQPSRTTVAEGGMPRTVIRDSAGNTLRASHLDMPAWMTTLYGIASEGVTLPGYALSETQSARAAYAMATTQGPGSVNEGTEVDGKAHLTTFEQWSAGLPVGGWDGWTDDQRAAAYPPADREGESQP